MFGGGRRRVISVTVQGVFAVLYVKVQSVLPSGEGNKKMIARGSWDEVCQWLLK